MEEQAKYSNSKTGFYWDGNKLMYFSICLAQITLRRSLFKRWYNVEVFYPTDEEIELSVNFEQLKQIIEDSAKNSIQKIQSYAGY